MVLVRKSIYTARGHNLRLFDDVIFVLVCCLNRSAIAGLLSRFKQQTGAKMTSQKPQIVTARSIMGILAYRDHSFLFYRDQ